MAVETILQAVPAAEEAAHLAEGTASEMEVGSSGVVQGVHLVLEAKAAGLPEVQPAAGRAEEMVVGVTAVDSEVAATALR